jgi:alpha-tubulin suppressor-like RCC1 family protein
VGKYFSNNINNYEFTLGQASNSSYVITNDYKLYGCGANPAPGIMSDTDIAGTSSFLQVPNTSNVNKLFKGSPTSNSFVIKTDGSLWATGNNGNGQLGTGNTTSVTSFTKVYEPTGGVTCIAVSCGQTHTQMLLSDGSLWATGNNISGQLGTGNTTPQTSFTKVYDPSLVTNSGVTCVSVSCGSDFTQIVLSDGSLWATGRNSNGRLGTGNTTQQTSFTKVYDPSLVTNSGVTCVSVSCGSEFTQMLLSDGSLWATGVNFYGQLGTENTIDISSFTRVYNPVINSGITCVAVSCGSYHTQIVLSDGSLWATGDNWSGPLGTGNTTDVSSFTKVYTPTDGITCVSVSCGSEFTQMLLSDGSLWATGVNFYGQLGTGNTTNVSSFTKVYTPTGGVTCVAVSCGYDFTQRLMSDGSLWATGRNITGQLGTGNQTQQTSFVNMLNSDGVNMSNVLTLPEILSSTAPTAPTAPVITSVNSISSTHINPTVSISFTQSPADSTITNYSYSTDGTTYVALSPAQTSTPLIIPATGLTSGSSYIFTIKANNPSGSSSASTSVSSTFYMPPTAPTITSVSYNHPDSVKVYFTQTNNSGVPITGYSYSLDNGQTYTVKNGVTTSPLTISGLKSGITNSIVLKSNNGQDSAASNISSFTHYVSKGKKKVLT